MWVCVATASWAMFLCASRTPSLFASHGQSYLCVCVFCCAQQRNLLKAYMAAGIHGWRTLLKARTTQWESPNLSKPSAKSVPHVGRCADSAMSCCIHTPCSLQNNICLRNQTYQRFTVGRPAGTSQRRNPNKRYLQNLILTTDENAGTSQKRNPNKSADKKAILTTDEKADTGTADVRHRCKRSAFELTHWNLTRNAWENKKSLTYSHTSNMPSKTWPDEEMFQQCAACWFTHTPLILLITIFVSAVTMSGFHPTFVRSENGATFYTATTDTFCGLVDVHALGNVSCWKGQ